MQTMAAAVWAAICTLLVIQTDSVAVQKPKALRLLGARSLSAARLPDPTCSSGIVSVKREGKPQACCAGYCGECSDYPTCRTVRGQNSTFACCSSQVLAIECGKGAPANKCLKKCTEAVPPCIMPSGKVFTTPSPDARHAGADCNKAIPNWRLKTKAALDPQRSAQMIGRAPIERVPDGSAPEFSKGYNPKEHTKMAISNGYNPKEHSANHIPNGYNPKEHTRNHISNGYTPGEHTADHISNGYKPKEHTANHISNGYNPKEHTADHISNGYNPKEHTANHISNGYTPEEHTADHISNGYKPKEHTADHISNGYTPGEHTANHISNGYNPKEHTANHISNGYNPKDHS